jgi:antitoxin component YwqK of YwqJK toxin-antitoxin module
MSASAIRAILGPMPPSSEPSPEVVLYGNGRPKYRGSNLDGQMHGAWEWYRLDGSLMRSGAFDRGRQVGVWRTYDRAGRVVKETTFGAETEGSS